MANKQFITSGTLAGYKWARARGYDRKDLENYDGRSQSFAAGIEMWVVEQEERAKKILEQQAPSSNTSKTID